MQDSYGSADGLELRTIDRPTAGDDEVLVEVHAAGLDQAVWHLMAGLPYLARMAVGLRRPKMPVPGLDFAGVVNAVGAKVTGFQPGDEVFGSGQGAYAEYALAKAKHLLHKPAELSFEQAAAIPVSALAALHGLRDTGNVQPGQHVLVIGAAGGVGSYAVQIAKAFGAEVTGVCRTEKADLARKLGADHVVDYTKEDFAAGLERYDLILDTGGHTKVARLRRALTERGTLVIAGSETDGKWFGGLGRPIRAVLLSPLVRHRLKMYYSAVNQEDLRTVTELVVSGKVSPAIDRTFPLHAAPDAIRYLRDGKVRGKVVIAVRG